MAHIAIIGPGAIGGAIAAWLQSADQHEITLCARRPLNEIILESTHGQVKVSPHVITSPEEAKPVDCVMIATKTYQSDAMAPWLAKLTSENTTVAILQNGVEHVERFSPYLNPSQILPVIVRISTERSEPTKILHRGISHLQVPNNDRGREFAAYFIETPVEVTCESDFTTIAWRKLCGNIGGIVNALLLQPSSIFHDEEIFRMARDIVEEGVAVGRAEGAAFDDTVVDSVLAGLRRAPLDSINSMLADRMENRPMEIDSRNGVIVRRGQKHGIPTPCNRMAVTLLEAMTNSAPDSSPA